MDDLLSVYKHPALTVLIDDSRSFLDSLTFQLNPRLAYKAFHDPQAAIDFLRHAYRYAAVDFHEPIQVGYDEQADSLEQRRATIALDPIYRTATNRQRFSIPAVLVVDYSMLHMNGVELCAAIRDLPCKKILLTGHADENIAVDAFNRNLIDRFIKKNEPNLVSRLEAELTALQKAYFLEQTRTLNNLLARHTYAFLADPAITALVEQLCDRHRFVEYYLFPNPDGILFFDGHGKATLMVLSTKQSILTQLELAQDQCAPPELLSALRELRLVTFFSDTGGMYQQEIGDDWLQYCLPAEICHGRQDYYWALFELPSRFLPDAIYPYEDFLHDHMS